MTTFTLFTILMSWPLIFTVQYQSARWACRSQSLIQAQGGPSPIDSCCDVLTDYKRLI